MAHEHRAARAAAEISRFNAFFPVIMSAAVLAQTVEGWSGAPQSLYTDHFMDTQPIDGPIGFKLESPPLHPVILATTMPGYGQAHADLLAKFPHTQGQQVAGWWLPYTRPRPA